MRARTVSFLRLGLALALIVAVAAPSFAQAPPNPSLARVRYNTLKNSSKPAPEVQAQIAEIDKQLAEANRVGRTSEVRRLYAKGTALLSGRGWTELDDFESSLVLRTDRVIVDSSAPAIVRLEQIYAPTLALTSPLMAKASIRPAAAPGLAGGRGNAAAAAPPPTPLGEFTDVSRDLRDMPLAMELDLSKVADGTHTLVVEVSDGQRALGAATLRIAVQKGLDARLAKLDAAAAAAPAEVQPDLRYPADYVRKINRGLIDLGAFNVEREIAAAETIAAAAKGGKNPFTGRTGDFERHYVLPGSGEIMPYRVFVPKSYDGSRPFPLIVALHGLGANEDSMFDGYNRRVPTLAEERGYIVVAPLGYRIDGFYGYAALAGGDAASRRRSELSELDVMEVLKRMRAQYKVDDSRVYLMGHSMGAIGTWAIAAKYPDIWTALGPFAGLGNPASIERMKHIPQIVVHGDNDPTVNVSGSRTMVAEMKKHGVDHVYIEVPGGTHSDVVAPNMAAVFDFFDKKRKSPSATQQ